VKFSAVNDDAPSISVMMFVIMQSSDSSRLWLSKAACDDAEQ